MKTKILLIMTAFIAACAQEIVYDELAGCPEVEIKSADRSIVQKAGGHDLFKIEMTGYEGHCYFDERIGKVKAVVAPRFKITRLDDTNVEDVHFSYYLETVEGPARFLGKKTYFAEVRIPKGSFEAYHTAEKGELSVPAGEYDVDMIMGLYAVKEDLEYKVR